MAKCDYYDLSIFCPCCMIDEWQSRSKTRKHTNNSLWSSSVQGPSYCARPDTKKIPLKEQLKSNDRRLHDDSSSDRLFLMKLDIGLPLTEKSTDGRRPVVEDMEVSFSKHSRLSYGGFQHSEDTYNLLSLQGFTPATGSPTFVISSCLYGCQLNKTHSNVFLYSEPSKQKHQGTNIFIS